VALAYTQDGLSHWLFDGADDFYWIEGAVGTATLAAGNNDDFDPGSATLLLLTGNSDGSSIVTGFKGAGAGRRLVVSNVSTYKVALSTSGSSPSAAENRIVGNGGARIVLDQNATCTLVSDIAAPEWRVAAIARSDDGFRQTIDGWYQENCPASQTDVAMTRLSGTTDNPTAWIAPRAGSVTAIALHSNAARSGGTCRAKVFKNGSEITASVTALLDGSNTTFNSATQAKDVATFSAGDILEVRLTSSSWAPTSADVRASLEVET